MLLVVKHMEYVLDVFKPEQGNELEGYHTEYIKG